MQQNQFALSIVVIGKNQEMFLSDCFASIQSMAWNGVYEIIYVDTASTDNSMQIARAYGIEALSIHPPNPTAAIARNVGWKIAQYPLVLFLDGDTILHRNFVNAAIQSFEDPSVGAVCGHRRERFPEKSIYQCILDLDWVYSTGEVDWCGGDVIIRKNVLEILQGFNGFLIAGEDAEVCQRIREKGFRVLRLNIPMTLHDLRIHSFSQYWKRCYRTGYAYAAVAKTTQKKLWQQESMYNLCKGSGILLGVLISITFLYWTPLPIFMFIAVMAILTFRTAFQVCRLCHSWASCLAYSLHAHFQHIPMLFGQLAFFLNPKQPLIEYQ